MSNNKLLTDTYKYVKRTSANQKLRSHKGNVENLTAGKIIPSVRPRFVPVNTDLKPSTSKKEPDSPVLTDKELLRQFDMTLEFGPCIGITRLERWERAEKHGLNPSPEVKVIILQNKDNPKFTECVWNDYTI